MGASPYLQAPHIFSQRQSPHFQINMKVLCLVLLIAVAAQAENCQVYKNGIESIFSKMPAVNSASDPNDGVCEDGEGWGCIAETATTVMDCIAEIGLDPNGVQKCVEEAIGTASDCWDCVCWVMASVGLGCPSA